jgi:hypothetical protein
LSGGLTRSLRQRDLVLVVIGTVIGSGIWLVPGTVLRNTAGDPGVALVVRSHLPGESMPRTAYGNVTGVAPAALTARAGTKRWTGSLATAGVSCRSGVMPSRIQSDRPFVAATRSSPWTWRSSTHTVGRFNWSGCQWPPSSKDT